MSPPPTLNPATAHLRPLSGDRHKVMCGRCRYPLGFSKPRVPSDPATVKSLTRIMAERQAGGSMRSHWDIEAPTSYRGYRAEPGDDPDAYRLWEWKPEQRSGDRDERQRGRAPLLPGLQTANVQAAGGHLNVGRFPTPPCRILCPKCRHWSIVDMGTLEQKRGTMDVSG
jgi:hypothetical protein